MLVKPHWEQVAVVDDVFCEWSFLFGSEAITVPLIEHEIQEISESEILSTKESRLTSCFCHLVQKRPEHLTRCIHVDIAHLEGVEESHEDWRRVGV